MLAVDSAAAWHSGAALRVVAAHCACCVARGRCCGYSAAAIRWPGAGRFCRTTSGRSASRLRQPHDGLQPRNADDREGARPSSSAAGRYQIVPDATNVDAVLTGEVIGVARQPVSFTDQQLASRYVDHDDGARRAARRAREQGAVGESRRSCFARSTRRRAASGRARPTPPRSSARIPTRSTA